MKIAKFAILVILLFSTSTSTADELTIKQRDFSYFGDALNGIVGNTNIDFQRSFTEISEVRLHVWGHTDTDWGSPDDIVGCPAKVVAWFTETGELDFDSCLRDYGPEENSVLCTYGFSDFKADVFEHEISLVRMKCWEYSSYTQCGYSTTSDFGFLLDGQASLMLSSRWDRSHYCGKVLAYVDSMDITIIYEGDVATENLNWGTVKASYR